MREFRVRWRRNGVVLVLIGAAVTLTPSCAEPAPESSTATTEQSSPDAAASAKPEQTRTVIRVPGMT